MSNELLFHWAFFFSKLIAFVSCNIEIYYCDISCSLSLHADYWRANVSLKNIAIFSDLSNAKKNAHQTIAKWDKAKISPIVFTLKVVLTHTVWYFSFNSRFFFCCVLISISSPPITTQYFLSVHEKKPSDHSGSKSFKMYTINIHQDGIGMRHSSLKNGARSLLNGRPNYAYLLTIRWIGAVRFDFRWLSHVLFMCSLRLVALLRTGRNPAEY